MKQFNFFKQLLIVALFCTPFITNAQAIHPISYGFLGTATTSNWYEDYVGTRFAVTSPSSVAGDKLYSNATVADGWTSVLYTSLPLINIAVIMGPSGDTDACATLAPGSMTGKIALIWRGTCEFGAKALQAQNAGAVACVIVNNVPGGLPVGMGAGAVGATVTIPTYMISNTDGLAIAAVYAGGSGSVTMTITPWGQLLQNDLGFIPQGVSNWQNFATPSNQMVSSGNPVQMQGVDGAFVANYGSHKSTGVALNTTVKFTPTGGSPTTIHSGSVALTGAFDNTDPATDSIWAMYTPAYNISGITGKGKVNVKYAITSDSVDQNPSNDSISVNYYVTDSLYSKGRYDFANNVPFANMYEAANVATGDVYYIWGNMYYVNKSGTAADRVQWSMSSNTDTFGTITSLSTVNVYLFKWVDGYNSQPVDSFVENGELQLVGLGIKDFSAPLAGDTSGGIFTAYILDSNGVGGQTLLDASSWYYVATELPGESGTTWFLGCDGFNNTYPRTYGRWENNIVEYSSPVWAAGRYTGTDAQVNTFNSIVAPCPFGGNFYVDSVMFANEKGLIPSVPMYVNNHPNAITTVNKAFASFDLYPNPASTYVTASLGLDHSAKAVTYTVLSTTGRVINKVSHNNIQNEKYTYNTSSLPAGNYFMVVTADGKEMFKKFTVLR